MSSRVLKIALAAVLVPEALTQASQIGLPTQAAGGSVVPTAIAGVSPVAATPIAATPYQVPVASPTAALPVQNEGSEFLDKAFGKGGKDTGMVGTALKAFAGTSSIDLPGHSDNKYSKESSDIVSGVIGGFMKGAPVDYHEKDCIQQNMGDVTSGLVGLGYTIRDVSKNLMGFGGVGPDGKHSALDDDAKDGLMTDGLSGAMGVSGLVTSINAMAKTCFQADTLQMMKVAGQHLADPAWLQQSFANQGVNIVRAAADAMLAYGEGDFHGFGHDLGKVGRKVLTDEGAVKGDVPLPPGVDPRMVTEHVSEGAMNGFFAQGTTLDITNALDDKVHISVDLNKCLYQNKDEWENIFEGAWGVLAGVATKAQTKVAPGTVAATHIPGQNENWQNDLMLSMVGLPLAAKRCGFGMDVWNDVKRATKNVGGMRFKFNFPNNGGVPGASEIQKRVGKAVDHWTNENYRLFGDDLGRFTRDVVFMAGDKMGIAQKFDITIGSYDPSEWDDASQAQRVLSVSTMYGGIAMVFLLILVAVRIVRPSVASARNFDEENFDEENQQDELQEDAEGSAVE